MCQVVFATGGWLGRTDVKRVCCSRRPRRTSSPCSVPPLPHFGAPCPLCRMLGPTLMPPAPPSCSVHPRADGNSETNDHDDGCGTMEAIYFGNAHWHKNSGMLAVRWCPALWLPKSPLLDAAHAVLQLGNSGFGASCNACAMINDVHGLLAPPASGLLLFFLLFPPLFFIAFFPFRGSFGVLSRTDRCL